MNTRPQFRSVKTRQVFWFLVVALVPMFTMVVILYCQQAAAIRHREFEKLQTVRDLKVRELNGWLDERFGDLRVAAGDDEIRGLEEILVKETSQWTPEDQQAVTVARALLQRYVDHYDSYHELLIVCVKDTDIEISNIAAHEDRDASREPYFVETIRKKDTCVSPIYRSKTERAPVMDISMPVYCNAHGGEHVFGVLVARINLEDTLYPLLQEHAGFGKTGETLLVNEDGVALNPLRWHDDAPLNLKITAEPATKAAAGETGVTETPDYRGEMVLAAYTHIPRTGWGFVAKRDLAEVYAPIYAMVWDMALLLAAAVAAVLLVAVFLSKTISRPILEIGETVHRVAEGDLGARYVGTGTDEIAALGASFNEMADSLASQMAVQRGGAGIVETMVTAGDMQSFASDLIVKLLEVTGSHLGAFYVRREDGRTFAQAACLGLTADAAPSFDAEIREGELGKTLATQEITFIENISEKTQFALKTTAGVAIPREIVTIPLVVEGRVEAIVSLATLAAFSPDHRRILDGAQAGMNIAFS